ncbi:MAG: phytoene/squalene synthase family protein [Minwuia sp.]|uniref:phytoene/squalene synthase family protein n=1 Tax=Minwuia sp. TaxID=2493630 RepID=UPI003A8C42EA
MPTPLSGRTHASDADRAACRRAIRHGSKTFFAASLLLPRRVREPAYSLYAFCRLSDDKVDLEEGGADAIRALEKRLDLAYRGNPADDPVDRAFADTVTRHTIPQALPAALIDGLRWDTEDRRYETLEDLQGYAARVAAAVGTMMTLLMGDRRPDVLARACDLGVAMQLTNIARDVGEDARQGRLYLPRSWMREAGIDPDAWLADPVHSPALSLVVERLLAAADRLYRRAGDGIAALPPDCRPAINAARVLYAAIGREVERAGLDSVSARVYVTGRRKLMLLAGAVAATPLSRPRSVEPALPETQFLLDAVRADPRLALPAEPAWWDVEKQVGHVVDLFERLEQRRDAGRA